MAPGQVKAVHATAPPKLVRQSLLWPRGISEFTQHSETGRSYKKALWYAASAASG